MIGDKGFTVAGSRWFHGFNGFIGFKEIGHLNIGFDGFIKIDTVIRGFKKIDMRNGKLHQLLIRHLTKAKRLQRKYICIDRTSEQEKTDLQVVKNSIDSLIPPSTATANTSVRRPLSSAAVAPSVSSIAAPRAKPSTSTAAPSRNPPPPQQPHRETLHLAGHLPHKQRDRPSSPPLVSISTLDLTGDLHVNHLATHLLRSTSPPLLSQTRQLQPFYLRRKRPHIHNSASVQTLCPAATKHSAS
ncbi:hypothetical protein LXL04_016845 [Taraxacum kok-saghyz]